MITLFAIGILILVLKLVRFALKATFGIVKGFLFVVGIPVILIALFAAGLTVLAVPLLLFGLLTTFLLPAGKGI